MGTRFVEIPLSDIYKLEAALDADVLMRMDIWGTLSKASHSTSIFRPIAGLSTDWGAWAGDGTSIRTRFGVLVEED